jgi:hypothetical protein
MIDGVRVRVNVFAGGAVVVCLSFAACGYHARQFGSADGGTGPGGDSAGDSSAGSHGMSEGGMNEGGMNEGGMNEGGMNEGRARPVTKSSHSGLGEPARSGDPVKPVILKFSEPLDPTTVSAESVKLKDADGAVVAGTVTDAGVTATFHPRFAAQSARTLRG